MVFIIFFIFPKLQVASILCYHVSVSLAKRHGAKHSKQRPSATGCGMTGAQSPALSGAELQQGSSIRHLHAQRTRFLHPGVRNQAAFHF